MKFKCGFDGTIVEAKIIYGNEGTSKKGRIPDQIICPKCRNFIPFSNEVKE